MLLQRATDALPAAERRWQRSPRTREEARQVLARLAASGDLAPLDDLPDLYRVTSPFAASGPVTEWEVLMEANPYATLAYASAFAFHQLTGDLPNELHVRVSDERARDERPAGVAPSEWEGLRGLVGQRPDAILGTPVVWHRIRRGAGLGAGLYEPLGFPVRVTTPEMTLLDALMHPEWCGGFRKVLEAWASARGSIKVAKVVRLAEEVDHALLRQRAGFLLEKLGLAHPALDEWAKQAKRGGSSKLVGSAPFASTFDERWKLSLNAPVELPEPA